MDSENINLNKETIITTTDVIDYLEKILAYSLSHPNHFSNDDVDALRRINKSIMQETERAIESDRDVRKEQNDLSEPLPKKPRVVDRYFAAQSSTDGLDDKCKHEKNDYNKLLDDPDEKPMHSNTSFASRSETVSFFNTQPLFASSPHGDHSYSKQILAG
ncbi:hypothetical protein PV328_011849, partial [Microctonus aethiopoides]